MSNEWDINGETDGEQQLSGPGPLRDAYKAQKKANEELLKRLEKLEAVNNRNSVADILESQGVKRSAAKYYSGDADPDKVSAFVDDMRSAFGGAASASTSTEPSLTSETQAQYEKMNQAGAGGEATGNLQAAAGDLSWADDLNSLLASMARLQGRA
jgi:hypothetical protein